MEDGASWRFRALIGFLKISTMTSVTCESIDRFINETKCDRYVDNPQLVELLVLRYIPHVERAQFSAITFQLR